MAKGKAGGEKDGRSGRPGTRRPADGPQGEEEWASRSEALTRRLAEQRAKTPKVETHTQTAGSMNGVAAGLRIASEFVGGILVGAAIGWGIDQLAGTTPFGLIVFLMIGFAAGVLNVIRGVSGSSSLGQGDPDAR